MLGTVFNMMSTGGKCVVDAAEYWCLDRLRAISHDEFTDCGGSGFGGK